MQNFLEGHSEMMETKIYHSGDFELIKYCSSKGPEYLDEGENQVEWYQGRYPKKTGRTGFTKIYKDKEGLLNHFIGSKELADASKSIMGFHNIEYK